MIIRTKAVISAMLLLLCCLTAAAFAADAAIQATTTYWYESFTKAPVGAIQCPNAGIGTVAGDMPYPRPLEAKWLVAREPWAEGFGGAEITAGKALRLWTGICTDNYMVWVVNNGFTCTSAGKEIALTRGLSFGFTVNCTTNWPEDAETGLSGISINVAAYPKSSPYDAIKLFYILDHEGYFHRYLLPDHYKKTYLGSSGTYVVDLYQDAYDAFGADPTGLILGFIEIQVQGDDCDECECAAFPVEATFDDLWIGKAPAHTVAVTASAKPTTIASVGTTQFSAAATDSSGHGTAYWSWSDNGAGGTFLPSANVENPTWTAPANTTGKSIARKLTVTATCAGIPSASGSADVTVTEQSVSLKPSVTISANPTVVGGCGCATLTWTSTNATEVVSSNFEAGAVAGSKVVCPLKTTTYKIVVKGSQGTASATAKVTMKPVIPRITLTATPPTITEGDCATLQWSATDAVGVVSSNFGAVELGGQRSVCPVKTTTYKITVRSCDGHKATATARVSVKPLIPKVTLQASTNPVCAGQCTTLTWSSLHAAQVVSSNFGAVEVNGSKDVCPAKTTTYSITVRTAGGRTAKASVRVKVQACPGVWTVGPYRPTFKNTYAFCSRSDDILSIHFLQDAGVPFPWATVMVEGISAAVVGSPTGCAIVVDLDEGTSFLCSLEGADDEPTCTVTFTKLECGTGGQVSGTVTGRMARAEDLGGDLVPLVGSFSGVKVFAQ